MKYILLCIGGAAGTLLRYFITSIISDGMDPEKFPWGTFTVNLSGSLIIGLLAGIYLSAGLSDNMKLFLFVGLLGGFTTFSSFSFECVSLLKAGKIPTAIIYILGSNVLGIALASVGFQMGQRIAG